MLNKQDVQKWNRPIHDTVAGFSIMGFMNEKTAGASWVDKKLIINKIVKLNNFKIKTVQITY